MGCSASKPVRQVILIQCANCKQRSPACICRKNCQNIFVNLQYHKLSDNVTIRMLSHEEMKLFSCNTYYESQLVIEFFDKKTEKIIHKSELLEMINK